MNRTSIFQKQDSDHHVVDHVADRSGCGTRPTVDSSAAQINLTRQPRPHPKSHLQNCEAATLIGTGTETLSRARTQIASDRL
jgi:hypothetical protein